MTKYKITFEVTKRDCYWSDYHDNYVKSDHRSVSMYVNGNYVGFMGCSPKSVPMTKRWLKEHLKSYYDTDYIKAEFVEKRKWLEDELNSCIKRARKYQPKPQKKDK